MVACSMTKSPPPLLNARVVLQHGDLSLDVEIVVERGETVAIMGPNGAGKTTFLYALLGWLPLQSGWVLLDNEIFEAPGQDHVTPTQDRKLGMVFQDGLLFPHLNVAENISFGAGRNADNHDLIERLDVLPLSDKYPSELSAGQTQRVALARTLAARPKMVLLDEPLASLDLTARIGARNSIRSALEQSLAGALLVTHDPTDAFALAQKVLILEDGKVTQFGTPDQIRSQPKSRWVADLMGWNVFHGVGHGSSVTLADGTQLATSESELSGETMVMISPSSVALFLERPGGSPRNSWLCRIQRVEHLDSLARVSLSGPLDLYADITSDAAHELDLTPGRELWVSVKATEVRANAIPGRRH
jgi:molybdate transport system ATP-binding protein